ncbi:hypothetical protein [Anaerorhabdus sp.]|uniref:hypothetical protein n=1 Tax=Anaerorhabdus sp. TaxID=1872524 RepID=UPI002FC73FA3
MNIKYKVHQSSIFGMDANIVSLLIYLLPVVISFLSYGTSGGYLTWLIPGLVLIFEKESKLVKFHAWQALFMSLFYGFIGFIGTLFGAGFAFTSLLTQNAGGLLSSIGFLFVMGIIGLIFAILEIIAAIKGFSWISYRLPIIGRWASNLAHENE